MRYAIGFLPIAVPTALTAPELFINSAISLYETKWEDEILSRAFQTWT